MASLNITDQIAHGASGISSTSAVTLCAVTIPTGATVTLTFWSEGFCAELNQGVGALIIGTFKNVSGTVSQVGATTTVHSVHDAGITTFSAAFSISGTSVDCTVIDTTAGHTYNWRGRVIMDED